MKDKPYENDHILAFRIRTADIVALVHGTDALERLIEAVEQWCSEEIKEHRVHRLWRDAFYIEASGGRSAVNALLAFITRRFLNAWTIGDGAVELYCVPMFAILPIRSNEKMSGDRVLRALSAAQREASPLFYDERAEWRQKHDTYLKMELIRCINEEMAGFSVNYQPIVDPRSGQWMGVEALCRWMHPELGAIPPSIFIQFAEELRMIDRIDDWILRAAIGELQSIGLTEIEGFFLSVNVSPVQLLDETFIERGFVIMDEMGFQKSKLTLEVTETEDLIYTEQIQDTFKELIDHGVTIAIDDFGTGYSTLSNLKRLPVTKVKTDCGFIIDVGTDMDAESMYGHVVRLVKRNDITLIAEGVETAAQLAVAQESGVDLIQGYYYSRPVPLKKLAESRARFLMPKDL